MRVDTWLSPAQETALYLEEPGVGRDVRRQPLVRHVTRWFDRKVQEWATSIDFMARAPAQGWLRVRHRMPCGVRRRAPGGRRLPPWLRCPCRSGAEEYSDGFVTPVWTHAAVREVVSSPTRLRRLRVIEFPFAARPLKPRRSRPCRAHPAI